MLQFFENSEIWVVPLFWDKKPKFREVQFLVQIDSVSERQVLECKYLFCPYSVMCRIPNRKPPMVLKVFICAWGHMLPFWYSRILWLLMIISMLLWKRCRCLIRTSFLLSMMCGSLRFMLLLCFINDNEKENIWFCNDLKLLSLFLPYHFKLDILCQGWENIT